MKIGIYSIYDNKNINYDTPFFCVNDLQAKRHYIKLSKDKETTLYHFPKDFELHRLGTLVTETGQIENEILTVMEFPDVINHVVKDSDLSLEKFLHFQPTKEELVAAADIKLFNKKENNNA